MLFALLGGFSFAFAFLLFAMCIGALHSIANAAKLSRMEIWKWIFVFFICSGAMSTAVYGGWKCMVIAFN